MNATSAALRASPRLATLAPTAPFKLRPAGAWLLVVLAIAVRMPAIDRPLVGEFATKNAVYGMIARNWALGRASLARPTVDCLVGGERGLHLVEVPLSAYAAGGLWRALGGSLDAWGRLTSVAASAASVVLLFFLVRRWHGPVAAWGAGLAMALAPVSVIYGQSFMLEASVAALSLATIYALEAWCHGGRRAWLAAMVLAFAMLVLTKVYMLVLLLPLALWPATATWRQRVVVVGLLALASAPALAWYADAYRAAGADSAEAAHVFYSVRASTEAHRLPHPLLFDRAFYAQAAADLATRGLSPAGLALALLAFRDRSWRRHAVWLASMGLLMAILPRKFHEMNYYYLVILPPMAVLAGLGWRVFYERWRPGPWVCAAVLLVAAAGAMRYTVRPAFLTPAEDRGVVAAAAAARGLARADEPIATMHGSTVDLLYYCDRPGWAIPPDLPNPSEALDECANQGARYLVVAGWDALEADHPNMQMLAQLPVVAKGKDFRVLKIVR
jgi:hypothetical protein